MMPPNLKQLVELRHYLHAHPELSGMEQNTSKKIREELKSLGIFKFDSLGSNAFVATHHGKQKGLHLVFRAELDALPISEVNNFKYRSKNDEVGHLCGHDGHMTILVGLAHWLKENPLKKGSVSLLFQAAEETGYGTGWALKNWPKHLKPDLFYALHNLPGEEFGKVFCKEGTFASASKGLIIDLKGKEAHAGEPHNGINPFYAIAEIAQFAKRFKSLKGKGLVTLIHAKVGEPAFGTSPGKGVLMFTLRAHTNHKLQQIENELHQKVEEISKKWKVKPHHEFTDHFYHTYDTKKATLTVKSVCKELQYQIEKMDKPFNWSEDFGRFTHQFAGAMFALVAGKKVAALHNPDYDFNDDLIPVGIRIFSGIIENHLGK